MARKNRPSPSNPQGLSDEEIINRSIAGLAADHIFKHSTEARDGQFLRWISSDPNIRKAIITYNPPSYWDLPLVEALEKAKRICRALECQLAAQLVIDEFSDGQLSVDQTAVQAK